MSVLEKLQRPFPVARIFLAGLFNCSKTVTEISNPIFLLSLLASIAAQSPEAPPPITAISEFIFYTTLYYLIIQYFLM